MIRYFFRGGMGPATLVQPEATSMHVTNRNGIFLSQNKKIELIRFLLKGLRVHINSLVIGVDDLKFGMMFLCGAAYVATLKFQLK